MKNLCKYRPLQCSYIIVQYIKNALERAVVAPKTQPTFLLLPTLNLHSPVTMLPFTLNKTLMKHIQNNQKSIGKSKPAYGF
jgi:hypothetical protein